MFSPDFDKSNPPARFFSRGSLVRMCPAANSTQCRRQPPGKVIEVRNLDTACEMSHSEPDRAPAFTADEPRAPVAEKSGGAGSFSLFSLLVLLSGVGLFLGIYEWNRLAALAATLVTAPAMVRTAVLSDRVLRLGQPWSVLERCRSFAGSLVIVLLTGCAGLLAFIAVSLLFGLIGLLLGWAMGIEGLEVDSAVVGTAGGMIWGMGGALLVVTYVAWRYWFPEA